jgi:HD-GYP domain-containing protein (c-di-GMP phosphodiesterase class II)/DNA-binding CsgD family transcriptional regulator
LEPDAAEGQAGRSHELVGPPYNSAVGAGTPDRLRLAELIAALSLATDLGMGQPMANALRTCLLALALGRALGFSERDLADTYYTTLLRFVGCTSDSHEFLDFAAGEDVGFRQMLAGVVNGTPEEVAARLVRFMTQVGVGGDVGARVRRALGSRRGVAAESMRAHCEVASMLAARLGLGRTVCDALRHAFERWDGQGFPDGQSGEDVPAPIRLALVARDVEVLTRLHGLDAARHTLRQRRGGAHDPRVVDVFLQHGARMVTEIKACDAWNEALRREPCGPVWVPSSRLDETLTAFADFADVKMPCTIGHSRAVAQIAGTAARTLGFSDQDVTRVHRAALLHDLGRAGISNAVWEREGVLSREQWEHVRLHAYFTERILTCCEFLRPIGTLAGAHHERLDGSGYHRGSRAADLDRAARVLAAADACQAMLQERPHRPARTLDETARELRADVSAGRLDAKCVEAVLAAAGAAPQRTIRSWPGGLTDREVEVLRLMARGRSNREMSTALGITQKTVGHHVQHIYDKLGFSTRAAAAVFALEQGLLNS